MQDWDAMHLGGVRGSGAKNATCTLVHRYDAAPQLTSPSLYLAEGRHMGRQMSLRDKNGLVDGEFQGHPGLLRPCPSAQCSNALLSWTWPPHKSSPCTGQAQQEMAV